MAEQKQRGRPRKTAVADAQETKPKTKKKKSSKKVTSKKEEVTRVGDFSKEKVGAYSPEHIISKLKKIRDNSLDHMLDNAETGNHKGSLAALALYEGSCSNLDREEAIARGETPGQGAAEITISIPGFSADGVTIAGQPGGKS